MEKILPYLIAAVSGGVLGALMPIAFKNVKLKVWAAVVIGVFCGLLGYRGGSTMSMTIFGNVWWSAPIMAFLGVLIVGLNLNKPFFEPKWLKASIVVRLFLGLFMFSSGVMMLVVWVTKLRHGENLMEGGAPPEHLKPVFDWLQAVIKTDFLWQWIFTFKIIFGILVMVPRTSTFGILGALPYYVCITIYTVFLAQLWLPLSIPAITATIFLIFTHWKYYSRILQK